MRTVIGLLACSGLLLAGCVSTGPAAPSGRSDLAWPAGAPRVRFEAVIQPRDAGGRAARFFRRLGGQGEAVGAVLQRPFGVAWEGNGLLVADPAAGRVVRISAEGRAATSPDGALAGPIGVAVCGGTIVVTDSRSGRVDLLGSDLRPRGLLAEGLDRPTGVACDGERVFVAETGRHRVLGFTLEPAAVGGGGEERATAPRVIGRRGDRPGEFNFPTALALAGSTLWVGDTLNFRLQGVDLETLAITVRFGALGDAPGEMPRIKGVAVDAAGQLWVSDAYLDRVSLYRADGSLLISLGGPGGAPGEFSFPAGVAAHPDGRVAVADSLNGKIQVFRLVEPAGGWGRGSSGTAD